MSKAEAAAAPQYNSWGLRGGHGHSRLQPLRPARLRLARPCGRRGHAAGEPVPQPAETAAERVPAGRPRQWAPAGPPLGDEPERRRALALGAGGRPAGAARREAGPRGPAAGRAAAPPLAPRLAPLAPRQPPRRLGGQPGARRLAGPRRAAPPARRVPAGRLRGGRRAGARGADAAARRRRAAAAAAAGAAPRGARRAGRPPLPGPLGRGDADLGRAGAVRQAVQAAPHQAGLHPGRRGLGAGDALRQRLLADHHLPLRGPAAQLQEHVQAEAAAEQVAGGGRLLHRQPHQHRQDRGTGQEEEEAHLHRGECQRRAGDALPQVPQTGRAGDLLAGGQPAAGEGGSAGLVLQPAAEGEAHDAAGRAAAARGVRARRQNGLGLSRPLTGAAAGSDLPAAARRPPPPPPLPPDPAEGRPGPSAARGWPGVPAARPWMGAARGHGRASDGGKQNKTKQTKTKKTAKKKEKREKKNTTERKKDRRVPMNNLPAPWLYQLYFSIGKCRAVPPPGRCAQGRGPERCGPGWGRAPLPLPRPSDFFLSTFLFFKYFSVSAIKKKKKLKKN